MRLLIWNLFPMAPDPDPAPGGGGPPPPAPPAPGAPPATPPAPNPDPPAPDNEIRLTSAQLNDRLERSFGARLKAAGVQSAEELAQLVTRDKERREAAERERQASLTREQQLQEQLTAERTQREQAQAEAEELRFNGHVHGICASLGIRNVEYALFEVRRRADAMPDDQELDVAEFLRTEMERRPEMKAALGMTVPPVTTVPAPVTTAPGAPPPPTPPAPGGPPQPGGDAFSMSREQWAAHQSRLGIG